jgi:hypothetical protein
VGQLLQPVGKASVQYVYNGNLSHVFHVHFGLLGTRLFLIVYRNLRNSAAFSTLHLFGNMFCYVQDVVCLSVVCVT